MPNGRTDLSAIALSSREGALIRAYLLFVAVSLTLLSGCATSTPAARKLVADPLWIRSTLKTVESGIQGTHFMRPVFDEKNVYEGNGLDGIVAYDKKSGFVRWRLNVKNGVTGGASIAGDKLYFGGSDGQFYCVSTATGNVLWTFPTRAENLAAPIVADGLVFFLSGNNTLYALNADTGRQAWLYTRSQPTGLSVRGGSQPAYYKQTLYVGFSDGALVALKAKDGAVTWERQLNQSPRFRDIDGTPVVTEDSIYVASFDGGLYALTRADGQIRWHHDEGSAAGVSVFENRLYYSTGSGKIQCLEQATGKVIWSRDLKKGIATAPSFYKGLLIFGETRGPIQFLDARSGDPVLEYSTGKGVSAQPTVDEPNNEVFIMSNDANLYKFRLSWQRAWEGQL